MLNSFTMSVLVRNRIAFAFHPLFLIYYKELIIMKLIGKKEIKLLNAWFLDLKQIPKNNG